MDIFSYVVVPLIFFFSLPPKITCQVLTPIEFQVGNIEEDPFFDDESAILGTPVLLVIVKEDSFKTDNLISGQRADRSLHYTVPLTPAAEEVLEAGKSSVFAMLNPLTHSSRINPWVQPYHIILPFNSRIELTIDDFAVDMEFIVVIRRNYWPTVYDYCNDSMARVLNRKNGYSFQFDTLTNAITGKANERFLEYYVGIYPFQPGVSSGNRTFSVYFTRASCVFWDREHNFWSEDGCIAAKYSTAKVLHCICQHGRSSYAGTQFLIPNKVPIVNELDFSPEDYESNPIVVITVCVVIALFILGLIICYLIDMLEERRRVGLVMIGPLGRGCHQGYYLITTSTSTSWDACSTASVSMQIYGKLGRSQIYTIKEVGFHVLGRGGVDYFLVSTKKELGDLEKIRVWHDHSGGSPDWFCRKIIIQDLQTTKEWSFLIDMWMSISGNTSTVIIQRYEYTAEERNTFKRRFKDNLDDHFDNLLLWVNLYHRPASERLTRCQRISCAFAILCFYMMMNIITFELISMDIGFNLLLFFVAAGVSLMAVPVGLILITMFRCVKRPYYSTLAITRIEGPLSEAEMNEDCIPKVEIRKASEYQEETPKKDKSDIAVIHRTSYMGGGDRSEEELSETSSTHSVPSTNIEDLESWLSRTYHGDPDADGGPQNPDQTEIPQTRTVEGSIGDGKMTDAEVLNLGRYGLVHAVRAADPNSFVFSGDHNIPEIEKLIDEDILNHYNRDPKRVRHRHPHPFPSEDDHSVEATESSQKEPKEEVLIPSSLEDDQNTLEIHDGYFQEEDSNCGMVFDIFKTSFIGKESRPTFFPVLIPWVITIGFAVVCIALTMKYGATYSYDTGTHWLTAVVTSIACSIIFLPLGALITSLIISINWHIEEDKEFQVIFGKNEEIEALKGMKYTIFNPRRVHPPLTGQEVFERKLQARRKDRFRFHLVKLSFYVLVLIPLVVIAHSGNSPKAYLVSENIKNLFQLKPGGSFSKIINEQMMYRYLENIFLPALQSDLLYNGKPPERKVTWLDPVFLDDNHQTALIGVGRIRQVRVKKTPCNLRDSLKKEYKECYPLYHIQDQDTATYAQGWEDFNPKKYISKTRYGQIDQIWKYEEREQGFVKSRIIKGEMGVYGDGGFSADFGRTLKQSRSVLNHLKRHRWIDRRSRGIFVEFSVLNPNVNIYADVILMIERSPSGTFTTESYITPLYLHLPVDFFQTRPWVTVSYGAMLLFVIILIAILIRDLLAPSIKVYEKSWFWLDIFVLCCLLLCLYVAVQNNLVLAETFRKVEAFKLNEYINLQEAAYWSEFEKATFSITECICFLRIWRIFIMFHAKFHLTALTINLASGMIFAYGVAFFIIICAFSCSGHIIFGTELLGFSTIGASLLSLMDQALSVHFFSTLDSSHRILGPIFSFCYGLLIACVALNVIIFILNESMQDGMLISAEKNIEWSLMKLIKYGIWYRDPNLLLEEFKTHQELLSAEREEEMKLITAKLLRDCLKSESLKHLTVMKRSAQELFANASYPTKVVCRTTPKYKLELERDRRMEMIRVTVAEFIRIRTGCQLTNGELKNYAQFNEFFMNLRVWKLERRFLMLQRNVEHFNGIGVKGRGRGEDKDE